MDDNRGTDDIFANSSTETVKETMSDRNGETICHSVHQPLKLGITSVEENCNPGRMDDDSMIACQVIEGYCKPSQKVYCPFCPMSYTSEYLLKTHLKESHGPHLNFIFNEESRLVTFHSCTLCHATFYMKGLLPLHFLKVHENALVGLMNCRNVKDGFLYCMYCRFTVVKSNSKALMLHLEKSHFPEFQNFILANCTIAVNGQETLSSLQDKQKFGHYSNSLNRPRHRATLSSKGVNSSVRRKLDFNAIEDKHVRKVSFKAFKKEKVSMEGNISVIKKKKDKKTNSQWLFFRKFQKKSKNDCIFTSTPTGKQNANALVGHDQSDFEFMQFRCATCHQTFRDNTKLLNHVSHFHKWPWNRIRPCYSCGFCEATFYRNSFLVKHTVHHHTPMCLRSDLDD